MIYLSKLESIIGESDEAIEEMIIATLRDRWNRSQAIKIDAKQFFPDFEEITGVSNGCKITKGVKITSNTVTDTTPPWN
eukprot:9701843-Ditylum_brightwellii.AAC.1